MYLEFKPISTPAPDWSTVRTSVALPPVASVTESVSSPSEIDNFTALVRSVAITLTRSIASFAETLGSVTLCGTFFGKTLDHSGNRPSTLFVTITVSPCVRRIFVSLTSRTASPSLSAPMNCLTASFGMMTSGNSSTCPSVNQARR